MLKVVSVKKEKKAIWQAKASLNGGLKLLYQLSSESRYLYSIRNLEGI